MRQSIRILVVCVALLAGPSSGSQPRQSDAIAMALADIEQQLATAWVKGDREAIGRILAPDWSVIDTTGRVLSKQQVMDEAFGSSDRKVDAMTIDDVKVRTFGEVAVVTGRTAAAGRHRDTSSSVVLRFTDVFARREGRWQVVASQGTLVRQ
jgi:ketosteroid isomerase-like protein